MRKINKICICKQRRTEVKHEKKKNSMAVYESLSLFTANVPFNDNL